MPSLPRNWSRPRFTPGIDFPQCGHEMLLVDAPLSVALDPVNPVVLIGVSISLFLLLLFIGLIPPAVGPDARISRLVGQSILVVPAFIGISRRIFLIALLVSSLDAERCLQTGLSRGVCTIQNFDRNVGRPPRWSHRFRLRHFRHLARRRYGRCPARLHRAEP